MARRAEMRRKARRGKKQPPWIWIGLAAIVIIAAIVAVLVSGDDDADDLSARGIEQNRPVEVSGDPLPELTATGPADPALGVTAPTLTGASFDGTPMTIPTPGRGAVIMFVAHWCPHCRAEVPRIVDHLRENPLPDGVDLLTVSTSVDENQVNFPPSRWLEEEEWLSPTLADSENQDAGRAYAVPGYPYFVAVDASGAVVARTSGEIPMEEFDALVQAALG